MHIYINLDNVVVTSFGTVISKFAFQVRVKLGFAGDSREKIELESENESIAGDSRRSIHGQKRVVARLRTSRSYRYCAGLLKGSRTQGTTAPKSR